MERIEPSSDAKWTERPFECGAAPSSAAVSACSVAAAVAVSHFDADRDAVVPIASAERPLALLHSPKRLPLLFAVGFPVDFPYVDRPRHANAVVFMEHDARFFPDGRFEKSLEAFRDDADVTLGFAPGGSVT